MTRVTVAPGQAVNVQNDRQYREGETFEADDREAVAWIEAQLVMPAKVPAKKASKKT